MTAIASCSCQFGTPDSQLRKDLYFVDLWACLQEHFFKRLIDARENNVIRVPFLGRWSWIAIEGS